jgi:NAD+ synthase (glutamine-hydrolysing)
VSAGGSLSPRGDWRAPSDMSARIWLEELRSIPDQEPSRSVEGAQGTDTRISAGDRG